MAKMMTVQQHVEARGGKYLAEVFGVLAEATQQIARRIRSAGFNDVYGTYGAVNVQGEQQQKLDVFANDVLIMMLRNVPSVAAIISEEDEAPLILGGAAGQFVVIFDPLDGSSNIDVNVSVGTIFSVVQLHGDLMASVLEPGMQVAAGYVVYGPSIVLVLTMGSGVAAFTLHEDGQFLLTADEMTMPEQGPYYSANEANASSWPQAYREFLQSLLRGELGGKAYSARYIGSLVADFHRTLLKGGVFLYPPTDKSPNGKLRLLYEANPLAMIAEQAGGAAINGTQRILELHADGIHQRTPLVIGSKREVEMLQKAVKAVGMATS